jgi:predicted O-methyltransferase YrrM
MPSFDEKLARRVDAYIEALFVPADPILSANLAASDSAGLPPIAVSPNQGKLLNLLVRISGARRVLEIGTLGGYSTTWLGRALPSDGRIVTLEYSPLHADVARKNLAAAGLADRVEIRVGDAAASLTEMIEASDPPFDFIFLDANKEGYVKYLELSLRLSRPGTVIIADNIIRNGAVMEENPVEVYDRGSKAFNLVLAADSRLDSIAVPLFRDKLDGMTISIVR